MTDSRGPGPVPDRWLKCPRKSTKLIANKFLAFKTPLSGSFDDQVPVEDRFPPSMVFRSMKNYKVKIGLWIDLTNTNRFYTEADVKEGSFNVDPEGEVTFIKLGCRGHGEAPSPEQTSLFINMCDKFIKRYPLFTIAVHCTHGFNRTGFMICSFLVEMMDWSLDAALLEFAQARPPGIYKGDYIQELFRRYDHESKAPLPPARPQWCFDDGESSDGHSSMNGNHSAGNKRHHQNSNHSSPKKRHKSNPTFMDGIPGVSVVTDKQKIIQVQSLAQKLTGFKQSGFPGSQPVSMDQKNLKFLQEKPYRVSWKADGTRYMMVIVGEDEVYFIDRDNDVFKVDGLRFVFRKNLDIHLINTLLDGEMVIDRHKEQNIPRYLIYDIVYVHDMDVSKFPYHPQRVDCINADVIKPRNQAIMQGKIDRDSEPFSVRLKDFFPLEKTASLFSEKFSHQLTHAPDGLVFQPAEDEYTPGQSPNVLKWKPPDMNSVDFRLRICTEGGVGMVPKKIGQLFVGSYKMPFAEIKYTKAIKDLNNKIIECSFDIPTNRWVFMRERTDKSFPNSHSTALSVCNSIMNPVTKDYLLSFIQHYRYRSDRELMPPPTYRDR